MIRHCDERRMDDAIVNPLRIGVMGCASIARRRMLPAMAELDEIEIAAVTSRNADAAREVACRYDCRPVVGYSVLLELDEVDAVYIPLPLRMHAAWVEAALSAGKHVLVEKPAAERAVDVRRLRALAADNGLVVMENVMFVHHSQHSTVRRLVSDGAIGELRSLHAGFTVPRRPDDDIRYAPALGGGALGDVGIYPIRAAAHFLGNDLVVSGAVLSRGAGRSVETSGAVLLSRPDGVTAHLTFGLEHAYLSAYELRGSTGRLLVDRAFTPPADYQPVVRIDSVSGMREKRLAADDQVLNTLAAFVAAVRCGGLPEAAEADWLCQAELLDRIREIGQADRTVA